MPVAAIGPDARFDRFFTMALGKIEQTMFHRERRIGMLRVLALRDADGRANQQRSESKEEENHG